MVKTEVSLKFEKYLRSIGGLENGWRASPNKYSEKWQYWMFTVCKLLGWDDRKNPFRSRIYSAGFFEISDGWLPLVQDMIRSLIEVGWDKEVAQVKQKFGGLRFYINDGSDKVYDIINWGEERSYKICETCGSEEGVSQTKGGWITTLCKRHMDELEKEKLNKNQ